MVSVCHQGIRWELDSDPSIEQLGSSDHYSQQGKPKYFEENDLDKGSDRHHVTLGELIL